MKNNYIKSPLNYTGGKYKLLPQIIPLFPKNIDTFIDLFCGGFNVGININANRIIGNDIETNLIKLLNVFKDIESEVIINNIENIIKEYGLSDTSTNGYEFYNTNSSDGVAKYNKEKYLKLRNDFNKNQNDVFLFFTVIIFAFNNQIRFNSKGEFNMAVNKRDFNSNIKKNIINFGNTIKNKDIIFTNKNFEELKIDKLNFNDFVYLDPPYLLGCANYNERDGWNELKEYSLLNLCDKLNKNGINFALSNVLEHKGMKNEILLNWSKKYNINYLNYNYNNCHYHNTDNKKNKTIEVLITNYEINN